MEDEDADLSKAIPALSGAHCAKMPSKKVEPLVTTPDTPAQTTVELLEATHDFPCHYHFKAIGRNDELFIETVVQQVRVALGMEFDPPVVVQQSSGGKHASVSVTLLVENAAQVVAVYGGLQTIDGLKMLL